MALFYHPLSSYYSSMIFFPWKTVLSTPILMTPHCTIPRPLKDNQINNQLNVRCSVTSLSIFYRYFHANWSSELANCMPSLLPRPRCTRLSTQAHFNTVQTPFPRVNQYLYSFFLVTGQLWNTLPASVFPPVYVLNAFKRGVSRHLYNRNWSSFLTNAL